MMTDSMILDLNRIREESRGETRRNARTLDVMVVAVGLTVALAGFFRQEITWIFAGA